MSTELPSHSQQEERIPTAGFRWRGSRMDRGDAANSGCLGWVLLSWDGQLSGRGSRSQVDIRDICGGAGGLAGRVSSSLGGAVFLLALGCLLQALG